MLAAPGSSLPAPVPEDYPCRTHTRSVMEFRSLGGSGLKVPVLSFGTATFGGGSDFYRAWGSTDVDEAKRPGDICLEGAVACLDTENADPTGAPREAHGAA